MKACPECGPELQPLENFYKQKGGRMGRSRLCRNHWNDKYLRKKPGPGVRLRSFKLPVSGIELVVSLSERTEQAKAFGDANALREIAAEYASHGATRKAKEILEGVG